jgi:hypothetical protein
MTGSAGCGCAGCAFIITGQPAANAQAVSPPAVEYANGKFDEPNTTTGPSGTSIFLKSGLGGFLSGIAVSIFASSHSPLSQAAAY